MRDGRQKKSKKETAATNPVAWPPIVCVNSPVEADDQLGYFHRCGLIDIVFTVDSDLIALGCFDIVTKAANKGTIAMGYTTDSVMQRGLKIFQIQSDHEEWCKKSEAQRREYIRSLFCLISCVVGNDYVKGALTPSPESPREGKTYADHVVATFALKHSYTEIRDGRDVVEVAEQLWVKCTSSSSSAQRQQGRGIMFYNEKDDYTKAFVQAFNIYHHGRYWQFQGNDIPDIEEFLRGRCTLVSCGMGRCDNLPVGPRTWFIKTHGTFEPRMMMDFDAASVPFEALPLCVLKWWLLARGREIDDSVCIDDAVLMALGLNTKRPNAIRKDDYAATYSNILQSIFGTTPPIPEVGWIGSPRVWKICGSADEQQDLNPLQRALQRCNFKVNKESMTENEIRKATKMNRDGQVVWIRLEVLEGQAEDEGRTSPVVQFNLECVPSMKSEAYNVELVFTNTANNGTLNECKKLSYCSCKAGAVSSSVCSHRSAVNLWLHDLQRLWPES